MYECVVDYGLCMSNLQFCNEFNEFINDINDLCTINEF